MTRRDHQPRRRPSTRPERVRILVYCNGLRTEPAYLDGIRRNLRQRPFSLEVRGKGMAPEGLVAQAVEFVSRNPGFYDEVWCVFDTDEFDIDAALEAAGQAGVQVAVSNPCFELWLLLHFADRRGHAQTCEVVVKELRRYLAGYDKRRLRFADFEENISVAASRAKLLDPSGVNHKCNPSTGVWRLMERISQ